MGVSMGVWSCEWGLMGVANEFLVSISILVWYGRRTA